MHAQETSDGMPDAMRNQPSNLPSTDMLNAQMLSWAKAFSASSTSTLSALASQQPGSSLQSAADTNRSGAASMQYSDSYQPHTSHSANRSQPASSLDTGMLDLSTFGIGDVGSAADSQSRKHQQDPMDTGMLDMSAFGMADLSTADKPQSSKPPTQKAPQQKQAAAVDTGMLDMSAFGMSLDPEPEPEPEPLPASAGQHQGSAIDSGMLDMSAFGMSFEPEPQPEPEPVKEQSPAPARQQQANAMHSGMLDMSAFGMAHTPADDPPVQQAASSPSQIDSGMLDMSAFSLSPEPAQPTQPAQSDLQSGMLDMSAFGMDSFAQPAKPAVQTQVTAEDDDDSGPMRPLNRKQRPPDSSASAARGKTADTFASRGAPMRSAPAEQQRAFRQLSAPKPAALNPLTSTEVSTLTSLLLPPVAAADGNSTDDDASPILNNSNPAGEQASAGGSVPLLSPSAFAFPDCACFLLARSSM